jgi:hypothetical protein
VEYKVAFKTTIEFDEISNWPAFEDLVADYFRGLKEQKNSIDITVEQSGDILGYTRGITLSPTGNTSLTNLCGFD